MIYSFLEKHNLDVETYYDVAAIGLCKAGATHSDPSIQFSTYAYKCMWNMFCTYIRSQKMQKRIPEEEILHYEDMVQSSECENIKYADFLQAKEDVEKDTIAKLAWGDMLSSFSLRERQVLKFLMCGYSQTEIGRAIGCTPQNVSRIAVDMRQKVARSLDYGYFKREKRK